MQSAMLIRAEKLAAAIDTFFARQMHVAMYALDHVLVGNSAFIAILAEAALIFFKNLVDNPNSDYQ